jgi:hypothetical protein
LTARDDRPTLEPCPDSPRSPHLGPALGALALVVAAAALVVALTRGDPESPDLAKRIVYVSNVTAKDDTDDKEIRADCPRGTMLLGGGSAVQHGNESPSVAMYQGYPGRQRLGGPGAPDQSAQDDPLSQLGPVRGRDLPADLTAAVRR